MNDIILELKDVAKSFYFQRVLHGINLTLRKGECIALVGDDGNGKSTLMRIMVGLSNPNKGIRHIDRRAKFAYIPEKYEMTNLKVSTFLRFIAKIDDQYDSIAVKRYCAMFKMTDKLNTPMEELTEQELHKVAIIQAFAANPDVLFMDEPLYKQDQESKFYFLQEIKRRKKLGLTVIMACHDFYLIDQLQAKSYQVIDGTVVDGTNYVNTVLKEKDLFLFYKEDDLDELELEFMEGNKYGDF